MLDKPRFRRPSHATVIAYLALFVALGGTGAYATHLVVNSSDVVNESLLSQDVKGKNGTTSTAAVNGTLTGADISGQAAKPSVGQPFVDGSLTGADVRNDSLTGADIADHSGVDTCPSPATARFGRICAGSDGGLRTYQQALDRCAALGLRLPSHSQAVTLTVNHDVPGLPPAGGTFDFLWTDAASFYADFDTTPVSHPLTIVVDENGDWYYSRQDDTLRTVCVTDPSS